MITRLSLGLTHPFHPVISRVIFADSEVLPIAVGGLFQFNDDGIFKRGTGRLQVMKVGHVLTVCNDWKCSDGSGQE